MPLKIIIWNAQHFDNQTKSKHSEAFEEKIDFLSTYLKMLKEPIDIIALLETGKTGNVNNTLIPLLKNLPNQYMKFAHLAQEGGAKKDTALGISLYISANRFNDFSIPKIEFVLGYNEQRAPLMIKNEKTGKILAFYHANANENTSRGHIIEAIEFIKKYIGEIDFFGGDMNYDYCTMDNELRGLTKLGPENPGFTHSKFTLIETPDLQEKSDKTYEYLINKHKLGHTFNKSYGMTLEQLKKLQESTSSNNAQKIEKLTSKLSAWDERFDAVDQHFERQYIFHEGPATQTSVITTLRFLDYAFVANPTRWTAECHGSIQVKLDNGTSDTQRLCYSLPMRSDHFPVIYTMQD